MEPLPATSVTPIVCSIIDEIAVTVDPEKPQTTIDNKTGIENIKGQVSEARQKVPEQVSRLSYNMGYGDFCFGRLGDRPEMSSFTDSIYNEEYWKTGSSGVAIIELGSFQRTGTFPFKLPKEIRFRIYGLLLDTFYAFINEERASYIKIRVGADPSNNYDNEWDDYWDKDFDQVLEIHRRLDVIIYGSKKNATLSQDKYETQKAEFERKKAIMLHRREVHPGRSGGYNLDCGPQLKIRQASNVSCLFRHELALVFCTRVHIVTGDDDDMWEIPRLLEDRPSIWKGIKSLYLMLDLQFNTSEDSEEFSVWCEKISVTLVLDHVEFYMWIEEEVLETLRPGHQPLAASRKLNVVKSFKSFKIFLGVIAWKNRHLIAEEEFERYAEELERKYRRILRELMLPDTLRSSSTDSGSSTASLPQPENLLYAHSD